nr:hypothetical protein L204_00551 [Cryptococcus depauperatus CBS 7855]
MRPTSLLVVFVTFLQLVPNGSAESVMLTRRSTGERHSPIVKRLIADSPNPNKSDSPRTTGAGIRRRGIVKNYYQPARVRREETNGENGSAKDDAKTNPPTTTTGQTAWAKPSDSPASLVGVISEGDAIVYTIDIKVGKEGVTVPVLVDTGSADLWVAGTSCPDCVATHMVDSKLKGEEGCTVVSKNYGKGSAKGCMVPTNVQIGNYQLENFPVIAAETVAEFDGSYMRQVIGIFGLAMNKSAYANKATPLNRLSQLNMISTPEVGFYLDREVTGSKMVFGSPHDDPHADKSNKVVLQQQDSSNGLYQVSLDGFVSYGNLIKSGSKAFSMANLPVILDTGTSDIRVPEKMMIPIYAALGHNVYWNESTTDTQVVRCNGFDDKKDSAFALQFNGKQFAIKWQDLVANQSPLNPEYCYARIQPSPPGIEDSIIIGSVFFHNAYHVVNTDTGDVTIYGLAP